MSKVNPIPDKRRSRVNIEIDILLYLSRHPNSNLTRIATRWCLNWKTQNEYIHRLKEDKLVKERDGRSRNCGRGRPTERSYSLTSKGSKAILSLRCKPHSEMTNKANHRTKTASLSIDGLKDNQKVLTYTIVSNCLSLFLGLVSYIFEVRKIIASTSQFFCGFVDGILGSLIVLVLFDFIVRKSRANLGK